MQHLGFPSLIETATYNPGGIVVTNKKITIVAVSLILMFALHQFVQRNKWGMAVRAMTFDDVVVPLMRMSINKVAALTFAIGSALAAAAGILSGAATLSGRGSVLGVCLAGFLLRLIEIFVAWIFPSTLCGFIAYSIIFVILTFRPHGFFGESNSARLRL